MERQKEKILRGVYPEQKACTEQSECNEILPLRFAQGQNDKGQGVQSDEPMTAIILAGGKNVRMGGRNKAFLKIGDKSFIEHQIERLKRVFKEVIISARMPDLYSHLNLPVVTDIIPDKGPLGGIYSGLIKAANFFSFVIACDMPFVNVELIGYLKEQTLSQMRNAECGMQNAKCQKENIPKSAIRNPQFNYDVVLPQRERGLEPLHAFYSKNCIEPILKQLDSNMLKMADFLSRVKVRVVTLEEIKHEKKIPLAPFTKGGGEIDALVNLNTQEEYETFMSQGDTKENENVIVK